MSLQFDSKGGAVLSKEQVDWTLVTGGDVCCMGRVEQAFLRGRPEEIIDQPILDLLASGDLALVNLEAPICAKEAPIPKTGPNFRCDPAAAPALKKAGFANVALANNHILDQDVQGLESTMRILDETGIRYHGAALTHADAVAPLQLEAGGGSVCFLNVAEGEFAQAQGDGPGAARLDVAATCERVRNAAAAGQWVVVSVHAGNEYQPYPSPFHQGVYRAFVDAGASVIVGHHPHLPQGIEHYKEGLIIYSLGNFLFDYEGHAGKPCTMVAFLVSLGFSRAGVATVELHPFRTSESRQVRLLAGEERQLFMDYINTVGEPLASPGRLKILWEQEARQLYATSYRTLFARCCPELSSDSPVSGENARIMYNLFRCDAHNEGVKTAFRLMHEGRFADDPDARASIAKVMATLESIAE